MEEVVSFLHVKSMNAVLFSTFSNMHEIGSTNMICFIVMQTTETRERYLPILLRMSELLIRRFKLTKVNTFEL